VENYTPASPQAADANQRQQYTPRNELRLYLVLLLTKGLALHLTSGGLLLQRENVVLTATIVGCDLHTCYQQITCLDSETGELGERPIIARLLILRALVA